MSDANNYLNLLVVDSIRDDRLREARHERLISEAQGEKRRIVRLVLPRLGRALSLFLARLRVPRGIAPAATIRRATQEIRALPGGG